MGTVIAVIIALIIGAIGGGIGAYFLLKKNPEWLKLTETCCK